MITKVSKTIASSGLATPNEKAGGMKENANAKAATVATIAADQKSPSLAWMATHSKKRNPAVGAAKPA